jgi:periplasmic divalent cation tolerance protein
MEAGCVVTYCVVLTNLPDRDAALALARTLVEQRLAACANVLGGCTSVYRWKESVESADEVPVLIKTRQSLYPQVEQAIRALHAYELPEIIVLPIEAGLAGYLDWIGTETAAVGSPGPGGDRA